MLSLEPLPQRSPRLQGTLRTRLYERKGALHREQFRRRLGGPRLSHPKRSLSLRNVALVCVALIATALYAQESDKTAAEFSLTDLNGHKLSLADHKGKV